VILATCPDALHAAEKRITYSETIAPILFEHCVPCHRPGGPGPFSLLDYDATRQRAALIATVTRRRMMPPWKPDAPVNAFQGERRLTATQIDLIERWASAGAPEGPPKVRPLPPATDDGWQLGPPDLVIPLAESFTVPAGQVDVYRKFVLPVPIDRPRWIRAIDVRTDSAGAIHHARIMVDATGRARDLDAADPLPGYDGFMADAAGLPDGHVLGWTRGKTPTSLPDSLSWRLAPGTDLVLQLHFLPRAEPLSIRPEVGVYFARTPATQRPLTIMLNSFTIDIPAGDAAHVVRDTYRLPVAVDLIAIYPHAHYLAKAIDADATLPDGSTRTLLRIENWDYNWQDEYRYLQAVHLPAGTQVEMRFVYDNSPANRRNPHHPPEPVRFGAKATDEMAQLMLQVLVSGSRDREVLSKSLSAKAWADEVLGYQTRLRRDPSDYASHTALGVRYLETGDVETALEQLRQAIRLAPDYPDAYYNLGAALLTRGAIDEAIRAYKRALELDPRYAEAHNNLGVVLESGGDRAGAVLHYRHAIEIQPHLAGAHYNLGNALLADGALEEAVAHYRETLASDPSHIEARAKLGRALTQLGERTAAVAEYRQVLVLNPNMGSALVELAWVLATAPESGLRNTFEATALARRAGDFVGADHPVVLDTLAAVSAADGRFDEAINIARRAAQRARATPEFEARAAQIEQRVQLYLAHQRYQAPQ
jgi:Flp pilus assembly protein TadD